MTRREDARDVKKRSTIGIAIDDISMVGGMKALRSVTGLARERGIDAVFYHLDVSGGVSRLPPPWLAMEQSLDGLVAFQAWKSEEHFRAFRAFLPSLPIVNSSRLYEGVPGAAADSYGGMREIVRHLIERHGYSRIAFILGPEGNWAVEERYRAYADELAERGLAQDPRLVTPRLSWADGFKGVDILMDERGLKPGKDFEAVIGSNDSIAQSAMNALEERGFSVPADVAVVGYDDDARSAFSKPPLTTAEYDMGLHAAEILLSILSGARAEDKSLSPAKIVIRRSCGCQYAGMADAASAETAMVPGAGRGNNAAVKARGDGALMEARDPAVAEMSRALAFGPAAPDTLSAWMGRLYDAMAAEASPDGETRASVFLSALESLLDEAGAAGMDIFPWQGALSALRRRFLPLLSGGALSRAESVWQQARVLIHEIDHRERASRAYQAEARTRTLRDIETALLAAHSVTDLTGILSKELPRLGIPAAYLVLYEDRLTSRLAMGFEGAAPDGTGGRATQASSFPSALLLPEGTLPDRQSALVVEPLSSQGRFLGHMIFLLGPADGALYESLRGTASSALQSALLLEQVQNHSAQLEAIVTRTLSTSEEFHEAISETARQAQLVSKAASVSMDVSKAGSSAVSATIAGMKSVQGQVEGIALKIRALAARTQQIGEIIGALEDIVAQSSILAINANIQAARAGTAGLGFAVVAREIRKLTEQSREANGTIGGILEEIRKATEAAAAASKEGSAGASRGMELAGRAGETIAELSATIEEAARVALQISTTTDQQAISMDELVKEVQAIKNESTLTSTSFKDAGL
jgi:DNA-binding LacI/PurR family transcriptional regulator